MDCIKTSCCLHTVERQVFTARITVTTTTADTSLCQSSWYVTAVLFVCTSLDAHVPPFGIRYVRILGLHLFLSTRLQNKMFSRSVSDRIQGSWGLHNIACTSSRYDIYLLSACTSFCPYVFRTKCSPVMSRIGSKVPGRRRPSFPEPTLSARLPPA